MPTVDSLWPADKVERWPITKLTPYARNSNVHSPAQVDQIAASIREWGWTVPALVDEDGMLIAGHGRILAAQKLGIEDIPVMVARGWSDAKKRAYVIADNKIARNSTTDMDMLLMELGDIQSDDFDLSLTGYNSAELSALLGEKEPGDGEKSGAGSLAAKFGVPPFSVLSARDGWWQDRKRAWLSLGIRSELGRGENLAAMGGGNRAKRSHQAGGRKSRRDSRRSRAELGGS